MCTTSTVNTRTYADCLTSPCSAQVGLHARQREEAAQKDRERMAAPKERHTLRSCGIGARPHEPWPLAWLCRRPLLLLSPRGCVIRRLLDEAGLPHLEAVIDGGGASLTDLQARLSSNRPMLLTYLRDLGIERLGERQQLANALTKAEKAGRLPPPNPMPHLRPATFEEHDDGTVSVWLQLPANTASSQLKLSLDANSLHVTLAGAPTALAGRLYGLVKPKDCTWQIERAQRAEYDPLVGAAEQPTTPDTMAITLVKAEPRAWTALFVDGAFARRYIPPPPAPKVPERKEPLKLNKNPGISPLAFKPRKFDPGARAQREAQQAYTAKHGALEAEAAARCAAPVHGPRARARGSLPSAGGRARARDAPRHYARVRACPPLTHSARAWHCFCPPSPFPAHSLFALVHISCAPSFPALSAGGRSPRPCPLIPCPLRRRTKPA